jgi:hypothetical protein
VAGANGITDDWVTGQKNAAIDGTLGERVEAFDLNVRYSGSP